MAQKQKRVRQLENRFLKKHPREHYKERNVIYLLTSPSLLKERKYIIGKAVNLTTRLSTYNKTEEHKVIYYQECPESKLEIIEQTVISKLEPYKEQANRDRFILPANEKDSLFTTEIKKCIEFLT